MHELYCYIAVELPMRQLDYDHGYPNRLQSSRFFPENSSQKEVALPHEGVTALKVSIIL